MRSLFTRAMPGRPLRAIPPRSHTLMFMPRMLLRLNPELARVRMPWMLVSDPWVDAQQHYQVRQFVALSLEEPRVGHNFLFSAPGSHDVGGFQQCLGHSHDDRAEDRDFWSTQFEYLPEAFVKVVGFIMKGAARGRSVWLFDEGEI